MTILDALNTVVASSSGPSTSEREESICLPCGSYSGQQAGSEYPEEISWHFIDDSGSLLVAGSGEDSVSFDINCVSCARGSGAISVTECDTCPSGKFSDVEGSEECMLCPAGRYFENTGAATVDMCQFCEAGYGR